MTAIPATVANVPEVIVLTPSGPDGKVDPATLVAAKLSGVERVFKAGGSQAVAAAAYGTQSIPVCRKIVGPGSPWLSAAKRLLAGVIDPGLPAGPSETIVFADSSANAEVAALDMLIESEHGNDSSAFFVTCDEALAKAVVAAIPKHWDNMSATLAEYSSNVLSGSSGGVVLAPNIQSAYDFINDYAPEHLQILSKEPYQHLDHIRNASEILLGEYAAGTLANYMMGPNCVLPTSGAAYTCSPLGVQDFLKSASIGHVTSKGFAELANRVHKFATYEGFDGHANAVSSLRTDALNKEAP
jgi:histidinol dehydrogenase